jgi:hypothetical protein
MTEAGTVYALRTAARPSLRPGPGGVPSPGPGGKIGPGRATGIARGRVIPQDFFKLPPTSGPAESCTGRLQGCHAQTERCCHLKQDFVLLCSSLCSSLLSADEQSRRRLAEELLSIKQQSKLDGGMRTWLNHSSLFSHVRARRLSLEFLGALKSRAQGRSFLGLLHSIARNGLTV